MTPTRSKKIILGSAVAGLAALGGFGLATANAAPSVTRTSSVLIAQSDSGTDGSTTDPVPPADTDRAAEEPLTGDIADQVTAAALEAVPGGTIERVETDGDGAVYEAHMTDADGNPVTVTFDADVNLVEIQEGRGPGGPGGPHGRHGGGCDDADASNGAASSDRETDQSTDESTDESTGDSTEAPDATTGGDGVQQ
jgi:hypothetical protein